MSNLHHLKHPNYDAAVLLRGVVQFCWSSPGEWIAETILEVQGREALVLGVGSQLDSSGYRVWNGLRIVSLDEVPLDCESGHHLGSTRPTLDEIKKWATAEDLSMAEQNPEVQP